MGAKLVLVGRREDELNKTISALEGDGHRVEPFDIAKGEAIVGWIKEIAARSGPLSGLAHCAGISVTMPLRGTGPDLYEKLMATNLHSTFWLLKGMRQREARSDKCSVVLLASVSGVIGTPGLTAYCASKGGVLSLCKAAAMELAHEGIRVNVVSPAWVLTPMVEEAFDRMADENRKSIESSHPLGVGSPEDVAYAVIYLLSNASKWVTGANFAIDGGYTAR